MNTVTLRYPLPDAPTTPVWRYIASLNAARRLPAPPARAYAKRWTIQIHPDDYAAALAYLQAFSIEQGLPPYNP